PDAGRGAQVTVKIVDRENAQVDGGGRLSEGGRGGEHDRSQRKTKHVFHGFILGRRRDDFTKRFRDDRQKVSICVVIGELPKLFVIASGAKQSRLPPGGNSLDCFVVYAPRNDECWGLARLFKAPASPSPPRRPIPPDGFLLRPKPNDRHGRRTIWID